MAANNYFSFTPGGTQYSAQPAAAYAAPTPQTAYVQPAQPTAYAPAPRAQTYDAYQSTHPTGQYAYATRTQTAQPTAAYDTKTYYTPTAAAPAATAVYTVAEPTYQAVAAKPVYTTSYATPVAPRATHTVKAPTVAAGTPSYTYQPATTVSSATSTYGAGNPKSTSYSYSGLTSAGYDAAVYSAATSYYQQQQKTTTPTGTSGTTVGTTAAAWQQKKTFQPKPKPKQPPKQPQLHYCEVCKISCAGPQTYREHLEGQKHKKKEAAAKTSAGGSGAGGGSAMRVGTAQLRCELCDVSCTGADAYAAHIRGAKHQKVLKLHTKLGKPIPSTDPVVVSANAGGGGASSQASAKPTTVTTTTAKSTVVKPTPAAAPVVTPSNPTTVVKKVVATPKITFVGGTQLKTTGAKTEEVKTTEAKPETTTPTIEEKLEDIIIPGEKDVVPVGQEYIEEVRNEFGNVVSFHCKLCECKFNDPNAKIMHMKGRRHRLQYKKKVDPSLQVEVKPSIRARKIQEEKLRRQSAKEEYWRRRDAEERWRMEWEQRRYEEEMLRWQGHGRGMPFGPAAGPMMRRPDTSDDRHVMAKHASIYPNEQELQAVQNIVSACEKSLKLVSDQIAVSDAPVKPLEDDEKKEVVKKEVKEEKAEEGEKKEVEKKEDAYTPPRALKGVMRVGVLAKGLLLHDDLNVHLVVLCSEKPTRTLLERVANGITKQLMAAGEADKYEVKICVEEAAIIVSHDKDIKTTCSITLTSPIMREENADGESAETRPDPPDVLDRQKCLDALAALRHAKWFQARANGLQSCVVVIRILRDLCQRVPTWSPLGQWAMELLAEKCVSSGGPNMSPGDALRRIFECISSGILLPGGPGLYDPCEKEPTEAASLANQQREDITASAQHALRLIAFRQIHKVMGMDPLPQPKFQQGKRTNRKRRRTASAGETAEGDGGEKKDKKEGDGDTMETVGGEGAQQA